MDEQDPQHQPPSYAGTTGAAAAGDPHAENLARYGAPLPPPVPRRPRAASPSPANARRRIPRVLAAATALSVLAVAGGAGFVLGRLDHHASPSAGAPATGYAGRGPQQQGGPSPFSGTAPFGGADGRGEGSTEGSPFESADSGTPATADQLTGLVRVASTLKYQDGRAAGTGMILTSDGEVVTNHHVVEGSTRLRVTVMSTGRTYAATVVGTDAEDDLAVLQLQGASGLATVTPDRDPSAVGDAVTAVGDAGGDTSTFTAATGTILATGQDITTRSEAGRPGERLRGLIKISSDVISGDSGGATYDAQGEVLGMTTAASSGGSDVVGFAIPIATVTRIADDLANGTQRARYLYGEPAFLGIGLGGSTTRIGTVFAGTPAAEAGIAAGDTVTRVGTIRVRSAAQLRRAVTTYSPGDHVRLTWTDRTGTSHVAMVTLMAGPIS